MHPTCIHSGFKVKELRYILRLREGDDDEFVRTLEEVKDAIGGWHDWNELAAIAAGELRHGTQCPLVKQMRSTAKQKFVDAFSVANAMRKTYQEGNIDWTGTLTGNSPIAAGNRRLYLLRSAPRHSESEKTSP